MYLSWEDFRRGLKRIANSKRSAKILVFMLLFLCLVITVQGFSWPKFILFQAEYLLVKLFKLLQTVP